MKAGEETFFVVSSVMATIEKVANSIIGKLSQNFIPKTICVTSY